MGFKNARFFSYIVAALHLLWSTRKIYQITIDFIKGNSTDSNQHISEDGIYDMPVPYIRYLLILFVLVFISTVVLIIGIFTNRSMCIAPFLLTMSIFIATFIIIDIWDVVLSLLKGTAVGTIIIETMDDATLMVVEFVLLYPVVLVFTELTKSYELAEDPPNSTINHIVIAPNCVPGQEV